MTRRERHIPVRPVVTLATAASVTIGLVLGGMTIASAAPRGHQWRGPHFTATQILSGTRLSHSYVAGGVTKSEHLTFPDDITMLGGDLFTGFQNGVGPQGQPAPDGNTDSTIVEFTPSGRVVQQWDVRGKCDGLTADPAAHGVIATVNEDANSSLYTIAPGAPLGQQVTHYAYNEPLPSDGGTDAISIDHGQVFVSASAPGTTGKPAPQPSYPAVYSVTFDQATHVADVHALFYDESTATVANLGPAAGHAVRLGLTDPDSNEVVPASAQRFGGDFMLTSQGDKEQIYVQHAGTSQQTLMLLRLSQSVDDTAWVTGWPGGQIFTSDNGADTVDRVTGPFHPGSVVEAVTPCDANGAPATCPAPPKYPANYLGLQDPWTGHITRVPVSGPSIHPQGMIFVPGGPGPGGPGRA
jgi:hypothetical protein